MCILANTIIVRQKTGVRYCSTTTQQNKKQTSSACGLIVHTQCYFPKQTPPIPCANRSSTNVLPSIQRFPHRSSGSPINCRYETLARPTKGNGLLAIHSSAVPLHTYSKSGPQLAVFLNITPQTMPPRRVRLPAVQNQPNIAKMSGKSWR